MPPMTAFARRLAGIVAVGVLLRLLVVLAVPTVPESDFLSYHSRAVNLLDAGTYGVRPGVADATWPPLYPLSLALVYGLAGRALLAAKLWNVALAGLFVAGIGLLGRRAGLGLALREALRSGRARAPERRAAAGPRPPADCATIRAMARGGLYSLIQRSDAAVPATAATGGAS
ncbi:MAG TPA: hypothetical protein VJG13_08555 [Thermoanaerobaculia bacterium]|nr:hypothetical protein [Thermoanaerobaculia bacterium]